MRAYLDSSALAKRAVAEAESDILISVLGQLVAEEVTLATSDLGVIEVSRAIRRRIDSVAPTTLAFEVEQALAGISTYPINEAVIGIARRLGTASLRNLDAIHLATASVINADVVIAYDDRLLRFAEELGFATSSPGRA